MNQEKQYSKGELEKAVIQITSIKDKSTTGLKNTKEGSSTYTHFYRLIDAMNIILAYLEDTIEK